MLESSQVDDFLIKTEGLPFKVWFRRDGGAIREMVCDEFVGPSTKNAYLALVKEEGRFKSFHTDCVLCLRQGEKIIGKEPQ